MRDTVLKKDAPEPTGRPVAGNPIARQDQECRDASQPRLDQALREMETIFDNALVGMALSHGGHIRKINRRGADILGYTSERLVGLDAVSLFPSPTDYEQFVRKARQALAGSDRYVAECRLLGPQGRLLTVRLQAKVVADAPADETIIWVFDDITEQKRLEEALHTSKQTAESACEAKSQLLANMSHELRTPLNGILGMAQLLLDSGVTGETREYLGIIRQSAGVLLHVMGDLLDLSNVEAGRLSVEAREFDLRAELEPLLRNFAAQSQLRPFTFSHRIDPHLPERVIGDPDRTRQICMHLLGNAFKFTRKGQVTASLDLEDGTGPQAEPLEPGRIRLRVRVADTGIGIGPEQQQAIFEPFGIGENYLTKKYSGAGLGLTIAKRLANLMGGDIGLESTPGQGSTFTLALEYGLPQSKQPAAAHPEPAPESPSRSLAILLAEDEAVNRLFTERLLRKLGHRVVSASDGQEALELLGRAPFDLVLMDIQMPRLNGLDATRRIRSGQVAGVSPTVPVVALTAYAMDSDRVQGLEAGMDEYVAKPFDAQDLVQAMARAMARADGPRG